MEVPILPRPKSSVSVVDVPEVPPTRQLEVEKKIELTKDGVVAFEEKIRSFGGSLKKRKQFTDTYYDTPDLILTAADHYLRQRNGQWELKIPLAGDSDVASVYEELEDELDIAEYFASKFPVPIRLPFDHSLHKGGHEISELMTFTTQRAQWQIDDVAVDIDQACFGFCVAEFEVLCEDESEVPETLQRIDAMSERFGLPSSSLQGLGKMEKYILDDEKMLSRVLEYAPKIIRRFL